MVDEQLNSCIDDHLLTVSSEAVKIGCGLPLTGHCTTGHREVSDKSGAQVISLIGQNQWCGTADPLMVEAEPQVKLQPSQLRPNFSQAEKFLTLLDEGTGKFTFQTFDDAKNGRPLTGIYHGALEECYDELVSLNNQGAGIFVTVNETDLKGRKKGNVKRIRSVWQEDDDKGATELPVDPHMVIESSPGKFHRYILTDSSALEEFDSVMQTMVDKYGSDPNAKDISRVLRLPGFFHLKDESKPFMVRIIHESGVLPLPWDDVKKFFPVTEKALTVMLADHDKVFTPTDIALHTKNIHSGENYNNSLCSISSSLAAQGMTDRSILATLEGIMDGCSDQNKDKRWKARYSELPVKAATACKKFSPDTTIEIDIPDWPILSQKALPGIVGKFVSLATKNSEADPAAVLATFLCQFGVNVNSPFVMIGEAKHKCLLNAVICGDSSKARKGTSAKPVKRLFEFQISGKSNKFINFFRANRNTGCLFGNSRVSRGAKNLFYFRTLSDFPYKGMLSAAAADYQDFHNTSKILPQKPRRAQREG